MDHVKDLLNLTGKETLTNFKENTIRNKRDYFNNNNYTMNNIRPISNKYEVAKNSYQEYNNNKYINREYNYNINSYNNSSYTPKKTIEEKISKDLLESY